MPDRDFGRGIIFHNYNIQFLLDLRNCLKNFLYTRSLKIGGKQEQGCKFFRQVFRVFTFELRERILKFEFISNMDLCKISRHT